MPWANKNGRDNFTVNLQKERGRGKFVADQKMPVEYGTGVQSSGRSNEKVGVTVTKSEQIIHSYAEGRRSSENYVVTAATGNV